MLTFLTLARRIGGIHGGVHFEGQVAFAGTIVVIAFLSLMWLAIGGALG